MNSITGKTAIVTGGGSGVGKATTSALAAEGVNVAIASRRTDLLNSVADELNQLGGGRVITVKCDVRIKQDTLTVAHKAKEEFGSIDFLINNAGLGVRPSILDCKEEEWDLVLDTNLKGTFFMMQAVLPTMIAQRSGYILNIASQAAKRGYPNAGPYCASKFGMLGLADALQEEVFEHNILVQNLCPALIQKVPPASESERLNNRLQVTDLANLIVFLFRQPSNIKFDDIGLYARPAKHISGRV